MCSEFIASSELNFLVKIFRDKYYVIDSVEQGELLAKIKYELELCGSNGSLRSIANIIGLNGLSYVTIGNKIKIAESIDYIKHAVKMRHLDEGKALCMIKSNQVSRADLDENIKEFEKSKQDKINKRIKTMKEKGYY